MNNSIEINFYDGVFDILSCNLINNDNGYSNYKITFEDSYSGSTQSILLPIANEDKRKVLSMLCKALKDDTRYIIVDENNNNVTNKLYKSYNDAHEIAKILTRENKVIYKISELKI